MLTAFIVQEYLAAGGRWRDLVAPLCGGAALGLLVLAAIYCVIETVVG